MIEHGMYFGKPELYQIIRDNGGALNDSKERPIICLIKSLFSEKYVDREYKNKAKKIHIIKNNVLLSELEYKLRRILEFENRNPNFFRQHITDIKNHMIEEINKDTNKNKDSAE